MKSKTTQVKELIGSGDHKSALRIASTFKIGVSSAESKVLKRGYECLVHPEFYKQLNIDCQSAIASAVTLCTAKWA